MSWGLGRGNPIRRAITKTTHAIGDTMNPSGTQWESTSMEREEYTDYMRSENNGGGGSSPTSTRNLLWYFFLVAILAAMVVAIALLVHSLVKGSTTILVGPPGPPGSCNLTQVNQTFNIFGNTNIGGNLTVNGSLTVNDSLTVYYDQAHHCVAFNTSKSNNSDICLANGICLETSCITSLYGNSSNNVTFESNVFFNETVYVNQTLWIGQTEFYWNGTTLIVSGNLTLPPSSSTGFVIGTVGNITQDGQCLLINATKCLEINGTTKFLSNVIGTFNVSGTSIFYPSVYLYNSSYGLFLTLSPTNSSEDDLELFSLNYLSLFSPVSIFITSPLTTVEGNFSVKGKMVGGLDVAGSLDIECPSDPTKNVSFGYVEPTCSCLEITSGASGVCFTSIANGVEFNATNVTFANGGGIASDVTVYGNLTVTDDVIVDGDFIVGGTVIFSNLTVTGNLTVEGTLNVTSGIISLLELDANVVKAKQIVSQNITTFEGVGAVFNMGTTLQVDGSLEINTLASGLSCASPIFIPNTPSTPTTNPCVIACVDMSLCTTTIDNLIVAEAFSVGNSANFSLIGSVKLGVIGAQQLSSMQINTQSLEINSTSAVKIDRDLNVEGNILQGASTHPCCLGQQVNTGSRTLILQITGATFSVTTSETTVLQFNAQTNPFSSFSAAWDFSPGAWRFIAPSAGFYAITVYLALDVAQSSQGTLRGVTLLRSFPYPTNLPAKTRLCVQPTNNTANTVISQVTCSYSSFFQTSDTFQVLALFDFAGPLTLFTTGSVGVVPSTRLEIYQF